MRTSPTCSTATNASSRRQEAETTSSTMTSGVNSITSSRKTQRRKNYFCLASLSAHSTSPIVPNQKHARNFTAVSTSKLQVGCLATGFPTKSLSPNLLFQTKPRSLFTSTAKKCFQNWLKATIKLNFRLTKVSFSSRTTIAMKIGSTDANSKCSNGISCKLCDRVLRNSAI